MPLYGDGGRIGRRLLLPLSTAGCELDSWSPRKGINLFSRPPRSVWEFSPCGGEGQPP